MDTIFNAPQKKLLATISFLFLLVINANSIFAQDGEKLFKQNCAVCHSLGKNKLTGPGLEGVAGRVPQPADEWLLKWIKNNIAVTKSGDAYAKKLMDEYKGAQMTVFTDLSDDDVKAIIAYIKAPPVAKEEKKDGVPVAGAAAQEQGVDPLGILLGVIAFLVIVVAVLRGVRHSLKNLVNEKQGQPQEEQQGPLKEIWNWMDKNRTKSAVIIILITLCLLSSGWYALKEIGVYEGYHPTQPIAFSHKIHAGDNAINCQYCHSGVEKSKTAGIPTVNVCMNCHKGISKGPSGEKGTAEIAKIYEAAGWDAEKGEYTKPQKPIKWVKVHNLPDFVFFSHQQHVKVGKQDCANCHGDVKEMTTVKQDKSLTMGWCIDCHKKTEVPGMKENPYYASLHKKLAEKYKNQPITVDKMGGIECAKCHY
jgi:cytochrome c2/Tfp pilus assembly protein PilV